MARHCAVTALSVIVALEERGQAPRTTSIDIKQLAGISVNTPHLEAHIDIHPRVIYHLSDSDQNSVSMIQISAKSLRNESIASALYI